MSDQLLVSHTHKRTIPVQGAAAKLFAKVGLPFKASPGAGPADSLVRVGNWGTPLTRRQRKPRNTEKKLCKFGSPEPSCTEMEVAIGMGVTDQAQTEVFYTANYSDSNQKFLKTELYFIVL